MSLRQLDLLDVGAPTPKLLVMTSTKMGTKQSFLQGRVIAGGNLEEHFLSAWSITRKAVQHFFRLGKHKAEREAKGIHDSNTSNANA